MVAQLLILDDDDLVGESLRQICEQIGYQVHVTSTVEEFHKCLQAHRPDEVLLDLHLGDSDGIEVLRSLANGKCQSHITLMSGYDARTLDVAREHAVGLGLNVGRALRKPVRVSELKEALVPRVARRDTSPVSLAAGIENDELVLDYQPIVSCRTGGVTGLEALVRWQPPDAQCLPPDQFIPIAEADPDLMDRLTLAVAACAAADWRVLAASGFSGQLSLNISAQNLRRLDFPERLTTALAAGGLKPQRVKLEITETMAMADPLVTLDVLLRLRLKGFSLSVDDFGTGFSSLAMLRKLPYTELKIDRSFVKDMKSSADALAIVRAVVALAQSMELETVAEGVEDEEIMGMLRELGATSAQGFGICRPVRVPRLVDWMAGRPTQGQDRQAAG